MKQYIQDPRPCSSCLLYRLYKFTLFEYYRCEKLQFIIPGKDYHVTYDAAIGPCFEEKKESNK